MAHIDGDYLLADVKEEKDIEAVVLPANTTRRVRFYGLSHQHGPKFES